jgi:peptide/nickel transport system substrate-binding protein
VSFFKHLSVKLQTVKIRFKEKLSRKKLKNFHQHDQKLVQKLSSNKKFPSGKQLKYISEYLTRLEKFIIRLLSGVIIISLASLLINIYWSHSELSPKDGGSYTEGLVGAPRYINPLFAQANDVDLDLSSLLYSGLLKYTDQGIIKDLAEDYQISNDQKVYTFQLRQDVIWHDGGAFDANDVLFTFNRINNTITKSPLYFNFKGANIEKVDDFTIRFILEEPFAPFLESLNVGILPEHIWTNIQPENMMLAEYNLKPIGTGPYKFKSLTKNKTGNIKAFNLERNKNFYDNVPYIKDLTFKFNQSFEAAVEALNNKSVEGISYLPKEIRARIINNRNLNFNLLQLPQYTAAFFNYRENPVLKDVGIRKILTHAVNKEKIVNEILNAEAQIIDGPILKRALGFTEETEKFPYNPQHAKTELEKAEWKLENYKTTTTTEDEDSEETVTVEEEYPYQVRKKGTRYLEFNLTTVNQPETVKIAKELQKNWQQIGAKINLIIIDPSKIQETIKDRDYEILLYGQILGHDPDPYPFWHSSQNSHPGLNLSSLNNPKIDSILDEARKIADDVKRAEKYTEFQKLLAESVPAVFLFNPTYTYPQNKKIKGFNTQSVIHPSNRFNKISDWYIKTDRNWVK